MIYVSDFVLGCNYWASDTGVKMWEQFNEETVERDLKVLSENGIGLLRVFPTWSYFQPIEELIGYGGYIRGLTADRGETILFDIDESAGINQTAIARFDRFLGLCRKYGISIIPSLITGWMSERIFAPPALQNKNLLTDPTALKWEMRFCKYFVGRFKENKSIVAWDLGNECNCMGKVSTSSEAWVWTAAVSNAIRVTDPSRPIISGMHSLGIRGEGCWTYFDQSECCDVLTTHSYASPENGTGLVPGDSFKAVLMPAAETAIYRGISKKPCFIEETGTYGEMFMDDETTAAYAYNSILNAWAHGCGAYLWWLAFDQGQLKYVPYGYNNRASNYGLFKSDRTPKEILGKFKQFNAFLADFKYSALPKASVDGVCVLPQNSASVRVGSVVFNLAKQAGINLNFAYVEDTLPEAPIYILPSLKTNGVSVGALERLMKKVENGAVLYTSASSGILRNFATDFGIRIVKQVELEKALDECAFSVDGAEFSLTLPFVKKTEIKLDGAKALAYTSDGYPIFMRCDYGKGKLFLLLSGVEEWLSGVPCAFEKGYSKIYSAVKQAAAVRQTLCAEDAFVTVTEHPLPNGNRLAVAVNNRGKETKTLLGKATVKEVYYGEARNSEKGVLVSLKANDMSVFEFE